MFSKIKKIAVLLASGVLLSTSFSTTAFADTTTDSDTAVSTATNNTDNGNSQVNANDSNTDNNGSTTNNTDNQSAVTQSSASDIDVSAVKAAMLTEINRLRAQNGLNPLTSVDVLNTYAQSRTDSFTNTGVDDHAGWNSANMYPYNQSAEENIAQTPFSILGTTDPTTIAQKITTEFYVEKYDPEPNYGHRKNMLNPYVNYIGIGVTVANGMVYFSQEIGNDKAANDKNNSNDMYNYYLTNNNDFANVSNYDLADSARQSTNDDYISKDNYTIMDLRGGVTTKGDYVSIYDKDGNKYDSIALQPHTDWASDLIAIINNNIYFHVSTNGFVLADDVLPWATFLAGTTVSTNTDAQIYDDYGNPTGQYLPAGSDWITDRRSTNLMTGAKMYRVGTNAWLRAADLSY
ncbi:CAP domain-containing protein [Companilactobacillus baiquanensis]|uniref:CAP domain-containing protein n=1 Tax=Companilactobacillus baiquanensis TaxID=2486005 RepID=A0ABW1UWN7_9LACO|nr:CAP domain-containing protein [Companilactobacillus baiquanensis]